MDAAIPADAQNAPTGIWKSRTEREIPTAPTPIIVVVNERKNNGDSNSVAKLSTESDQAQTAVRAQGLILWTCAVVIMAALGFTARQRIHGVTGDVLGASVELTETTVLVAAVLLAGPQ